MGGALSSIKAAASGDNAAQMNDALNSLETLARTKMDDFYQKTENQSDSLLLPIDKIKAKYSFMQAKASTDPQQLKNQVSGLIKDIAGGHWADAIADAATDVISDLLGSSSASVSESTSYSISVNAIGGVDRLDTYYFAYSFTSQNLITTTKNVVASAVVKSSVKIDNLNDNTLRVIINDSFPSLSEEVRAEIYEQMAIIILPTPPTDAKTQATVALAQLYKSNPIPADGQLLEKSPLK